MTRSFDLNVIGLAYTNICINHHRVVFSSGYVSDLSRLIMYFLIGPFDLRPIIYDFVLLILFTILLRFYPEFWILFLGFEVLEHPCV